MITNVQLTNVGNYSVFITNIAGARLSSAASLIILSDLDHDGMSDAFESAHGLSSSNASDALFDSDGDTMTNREEYIAGTDPEDPQSYLKIETVEVAGSSNILLHVFAVSNRVYTLQSRDSLTPAPWSPVAHVLPALTNRMVKIIDAEPLRNSSQRIYRLVTPPVP